MKDKKIYILPVLLLLLSWYAQTVLYSPLTPKAAAIAHFKLDPRIIPKRQTSTTTPLTEAEIKEKHGKLELVRLNDGTLLRGVIIEQGETYVRVETANGIRKIPTDQIDTVEMIR